MRPLKLTDENKTKIFEDFKRRLDQATLAAETLKYQYRMERGCEKAATARIEFSVTAYMKTMLYLAFCDKEVGWYGLIERGGADNEFLVSDVFLYPQTVTAASVRSPQKEFADWQDGFSAEDFERLRLFCHSHANMSPSPSGYDLEVQEEISAQLEGDQFFVFMILNKQHDIWARICDSKLNRIYETGDIEIMIPYVAGVHEEDIEREIAENVRHDVCPATVTPYTYQPGQYNYEQLYD